MATAAHGKKRYGVAMLRDEQRKLREWLKQAIKFSGESQAELARRLAATLDPSWTPDRVSKLWRKRGLSAVELLAIEQITGFPIPSIKTRPRPSLPDRQKLKLLDALRALRQQIDDMIAELEAR
jgi:hypothetical protein